MNPVFIYILVMIGSGIYRMYKKSQENGERQPQFDADEYVSDYELDPNDEVADDQHYTTYDADLFEDDYREKPKAKADQSVHQQLAKLDRELVAKVSGEKQELPPKTSQQIHVEESRARRAKRRLDAQKGERSSLKPELTPDNLMQGIIMAEILQPPRAKRPYRPVYMERED